MRRVRRTNKEAAEAQGGRSKGLRSFSLSLGALAGRSTCHDTVIGTLCVGKPWVGFGLVLLSAAAVQRRDSACALADRAARRSDSSAEYTRSSFPPGVLPFVTESTLANPCCDCTRSSCSRNSLSWAARRAQVALVRLAVSPSRDVGTCSIVQTGAQRARPVVCLQLDTKKPKPKRGTRAVPSGGAT